MLFTLKFDEHFCLGLQSYSDFESGVHNEHTDNHSPRDLLSPYYGTIVRMNHSPEFLTIIGDFFKFLFNIPKKLQ